jgi:hypothetical protein
MYDAVGNRQQLLVNGVTANSYTYDADDRLGSDSYDADGNTINSLGTASTYDFENHLLTHGGVTIVYDGDGNRVTETIGSVTTNYLVDTINPTGYEQVVDELQNRKRVARIMREDKLLVGTDFVSRVGSLQKTAAGVETQTVSMEGFIPSMCRRFCSCASLQDQQRSA